MDYHSVINLILFGVLFIFTFVGFAKGFLEQAIELSGAIVSFVVAIMMSGALARYFETRWDAPYSVWLVIGFGVLLTIGLVVTHVLAVAVGRVIKMTILRLVDRFTGAMLGLIMGMFVASLLITVTVELPFPRKFREQVAESSMSLFLRPVAGQVYNWVVSRASDRWDFDEIFKRGTTV